MTQLAIPFLSADPAAGVVRGTIEIAASPERVFEALTNPRELASWCGSEEMYRTHDWHVDARPGGTWSARTVDAAGNEGTVGGTFSVVDPARVIEHSWLASWDDFRLSTVRYDIAPAVVDDVASTRLTVTHTIAQHTGSVGPHTFDWAGVITSLARHVEYSHTYSHAFTGNPVTHYSVRHTRKRTLRPTRFAGQTY